MRKHNYAVGFAGNQQVVYGKDEESKASWIEPLTLKQAQKRVKVLSQARYAKRTIYKLVPVTTID